MLDWDDLRFFLSLARHGSLSAAAKDLHVALSTVGRRLASLEAALGVRLLNRTPSGYQVTLAGQEVLEQSVRLEAVALLLERSVSGRDTTLAGLVRVTCAETVAAHILAPALAALHAGHPDIMLELIPNPRELSLAMREADISVRLRQPEQHDLVVRRIGTLGFGLYASEAYLACHGQVDFADGLLAHHCVTQHEDVQGAAQTAWLGELMRHARISVQTTSHEAAVVAAVHGAGLACLACFRADQEPGLRRLAPPSAAPSAGIWLVVHRDSRRTPRVRVVLSLITESVRAMRSRLDPMMGEPA